ncbi:TRAP transporter large permease [Desulfitibacter alkalitolerans]|uniref:TRAP transporter large permease n=1 Tax=Desulfitibacter alkalitolerans TaxID=264641 RepID=UPI000487F833|nr:TRAP transporter large permease [Desulfitibacter alkalitolerans]
MLTFLFIALAILLFIGLPVAFSIACASIISIVFFSNLPLAITVQKMFGALDSFPLLAIPLFILSGTLMASGGISKRLVNLASAFIGHISGGYAAVTIVSCMLFGAISGSSAATVAAIGGILIPVMISKNYGKRFSASTGAASGELGSIIPPSIPMILYGSVTGTSVGAMFIAGVVPGILLTIILVVFVIIVSKRKGLIGDCKKSNWIEKLVAIKDSILAVLMPVIILGGIYSGTFTPTEAAAVAVAYALIVGIFIYRELKIKHLLSLFADAALTTATIMIIIAAAGLFSWFLTINMVPQKLASAIVSFTDSPIVYLLIVNLLLLVVGMFFEASAAILVLAPILFPIALKFGIEPIHFGMVMVANLALGMITPPVGVNLFISCKIANISLEEITIGMIPYLVLTITFVLIITYIPGLSLWLPSVGR